MSTITDPRPNIFDRNKLMTLLLGQLCTLRSLHARALADVIALLMELPEERLNAIYGVLQAAQEAPTDRLDALYDILDALPTMTVAELRATIASAA